MTALTAMLAALASSACLVGALGLVLPRTSVPMLVLSFVASLLEDFVTFRELEGHDITFGADVALVSILA